MRDLTDRGAVDAAFEEREAVLLKHGAHCPISAAARDELASFAERSPETPVYRLEVTMHRDLSDYVADRVGVAHASPQAFVLRDGRLVWRAEHYDIDAEGIAEAIEAR